VTGVNFLKIIFSPSIAVRIAEDTLPCDFSLLQCWKQILQLDGVEMVEFYLFEQTTHSCGPLYVGQQQRALQHRQDIINHLIDWNGHYLSLPRKLIGLLDSSSPVRLMAAAWSLPDRG
jgi:hypothetical protein